MRAKETRPTRGRRRRFDPEAALATGQAMFHEYGYDAVGVAAITKALGIKPPSFYAAFGSKAAFFERILDRYIASVLPLGQILTASRAPDKAIADLLETAARVYAADPGARGCLVLEAARSCGDADRAALARRTAELNRARVRDFVAGSYPQTADAVSDFVASTMSGLSASAREGWSADRLTAVAKAAAAGVRMLMVGTEPDEDVD